MTGPLLRMGVIGLGRAASNMIPALAAHPNVTLTGAADINPAARARFETDFAGSRTYESAEALCASGDVDAVYIATPHQNHAPDVVAAAAHGCHVIIEKPMALTLEECRTMTDAVRRAGVALVVGHTHAFDRPTAKMGELIRSGEFGRLRTVVNLVYTNFLYRPRRPEELDSALGGGIMYNQVPHQIEIIRTLATAPVASVRAVTGVWDPARRTEGALAAFITFADGAVAQLTYSGYDHFDSDEMHFWIDEGGAEKAHDRHGVARRALRAATTPEEERRMRTASGYAGVGTTRGAGAKHEQHFGFLLASCERADLRPAPDGVLVYGDDGLREIAIEPRGRVYPNKDAVIDELYDAAVNGVPPVHDAVWGTMTTAISLALVASARDGREIAISELVA
jgi:phthalate 4,5-cis-dihydrodiol dehydrogenase